ncbi:MAG: FAD-binding oxidoreductase [Woeseia sp.]
MRSGTALVVGGGIIGLSCAHRLLGAGFATTVISPVVTNAPASWGNAGHLAVEQVEPLASRKSLRKAMHQLITGSGPIRAPLGDMHHWLPFFLRMARACGNAKFRAGTTALASCMQGAAPAWRRLLGEIGQPRLLLECGHFVVWESPRTARRGKTRWNRTDTGPASFRDATPGELQRLASLIGPEIHAAIRFEGTGQFTDPGDLLDTLEKSIVASGALRTSGLVTKVCHDKRGLAVLETDDGTRHTADAVVIAAGVGSGRLLASAGSAAPVIAERGYHIQAPTDGWPDGMPPIVFEDRSMIVTNFTSALRASGYVEFARPDRPPVESRWRALQAHVVSLGLPFGEPVTRWMGARPTLPDYLPAIGRSRHLNNLYYAFGHQHLGVTMAALTAELIRDLIAGRRPTVDPRPFDLDRFGVNR